MKLQKGIVPANLSRGTEKSAACITCLARERALFLSEQLPDNRSVVDLFSLRPMLEAKAFSSLRQSWGAYFAKAYNRTPP